MSIVLGNNKNSRVKKTFLSLDTKIYETSKVDIILSPEFYWVRVFDIPVKSINQAKRVIPSLFEDLVSNSDKLSYKIIKLEENKYLCFGYINENIFEAIKNSGVNLSLINNVYFAQNECKKFKQFFINNSSFLYTEDGILIKVPNEVINQKIDLEKELDNINLSSHKIEIKFYKNSLDRKYINIILFCCILIFVVNLSKYFIYSNEISKIDKQIENLKKINNLPSSMIQINSILNANKKILQKEINNREAIYYVLLKDKFVVSDFSLEGEFLNINFKNVNKDEVEKYILEKYKIDSINTKGKDLNVRIKL